MVQIAAVSHSQDADVLVSALDKLGYNASVRSGAADQLLHVQIGPFTTRDEANAMRTKLLNDGYNAILK
jgi:cell division septation protein DedD